MPESLTTWKVKTWTLGPGTRVGQGEAEIITTKDLLVRLQAPRFFVQKDEVVLSANVHNKLKRTSRCRSCSRCEGSVLELHDSPSHDRGHRGRGEHRVDWRVKVAHEGQAVIRMKALTDEESDAAQMTFPAYVHGMLKMEAFAGVDPARPGQGAVCSPRPGRAQARAVAARGAVLARPWPAPGGCLALPRRLSLRLHRANTQPVPAHGHHPEGLDQPGRRSEGDPRQAHQPQRPGTGRRPRAGQGLEGLRAQPGLRPGRGRRRWPPRALLGWPTCSSPTAAGAGSPATASMPRPTPRRWSSTACKSPARTTWRCRKGMLERGVAWLMGYQAKQVQLTPEWTSARSSRTRRRADDLDALVFMVLTDAGVTQRRMLGFLDRDRTHLRSTPRRCSAWRWSAWARRTSWRLVLRNIGQYVVQDDENQTAYLKLPNEGYWWSWYGSEIETDAFYLKLLARTDPKGELAPRLVKYVLNNRRHGSYWNSTRDTAFCIEALADYLKASGEDRPDMTVGDRPRRPEPQGSEDHAGRPVPVRQRFRARRQGSQRGPAHDRVHEGGQGPALLQCLFEQFHARRSDHQGWPGDQGRIARFIG